MGRIAPFLTLLLSGCGFLSERGRDFGDCWKAEVHLSFGGAWALAGPVAQNGLGAPEGPFMGVPLAGWRYGYQIPRQTGHSTFPTQVFGIIGHASSITGHSDDPTRHACFILLPPLLSVEGPHAYLLHDFDFEVGGGILVPVTVGFSLGEFLDFLLGWFGVDIAGDDSEEGRTRRDEAVNYYRARAGLAPPPPAASDSPR